MLQLMLSPPPELGSYTPDSWRAAPAGHLSLKKNAAAAAASAAAAAAATMMPPTAYPSPTEELEEHDQYIANRERFNFLLVDDNEINLRIFERVLLKLFPNASVETLQDSTQVGNYTLSKYHIVFLDIEMPHVTGIDIAISTRASTSLDTVGLVAVTTRHMAAERQLYSQCGFDLTIPKPIYKGYAAMLRQIEHVLRQRGHLDKP